MGCHPSHWRTHIFQGGRYTTNQVWWFPELLLSKATFESKRKWHLRVSAVAAFWLVMTWVEHSAASQWLQDRKWQVQVAHVECQQKVFYTGWWFGTWFFSVTFHILGISSSQLTNSYFSEGLKPPTRKVSHKMSLKLTCSKTRISKTWNQVMSTAPRAFAIASAVHWPMANMLQFRRRVHAIVRSSVRCFEEPKKKWRWYFNAEKSKNATQLYCYIQTFFLDDMIHTEYIYIYNIYNMLYTHTFHFWCCLILFVSLLLRKLILIHVAWPSCPSKRHFGSSVTWPRCAEFIVAIGSPRSSPKDSWRYLELCEALQEASSDSDRFFFFDCHSRHSHRFFSIPCAPWYSPCLGQIFQLWQLWRLVPGRFTLTMPWRLCQDSWWSTTIKITCIHTNYT